VKILMTLLILSICLTGNAQAETLYVSDRLEITMRSGKSTSHGITRMLRSGTRRQGTASCIRKETGGTGTGKPPDGDRLQ
jgi:hypothetical protein